jgi:uncharacterized repeat protein (TIGR03803 family)
MYAPVRIKPILAYLTRVLFAFFGLMALAAAAHATTVATPAFSPAAGTYTSAQSVKITTTTSGASIRYTTNGTAPTSTTGTVYSSPVSIGATIKLEAIAYKSGDTNSAVTSGTYTINLTVAAPAFSPAAGTYTSAQSVTITTATSGATIRYTTNGTAPTTTSGTVYSGPVSINATTTLEAIAYETGYANSTVTSGKYTINLTAAAPTFSPAAGAYSNAQSVTITSATSGATIRYTTNGTAPTTTTGTVYSGPVSINATTTLEAIAYETGYANSTVTSGTYTLTVASPAFSPAAGTYTSAQTVAITTATSGATIRYTTNGTAPTTTSGTVYSGPVSISATATLEAIAYETGYANSTVTSGKYTINLTAAAPVFSPAAGAYTSAQSVTITSATSGATIRYTTNGTAPTTTSGTVYSGPVSINATTTLEAIAYETGYANSTVTSGTYTLTVAAPAFSPAAGTYTSAQSVTITSATSGATIRYTTNGTAPTTTSGTVYSGPVSIGATATLEAIAYETGYTTSTVTSGKYTINLPPVAAAPTFSPVAGTYTSAQTVTITSTTSGASIAYTTDGSTPTESGGSVTHGTLYSSPVSISATATLKAIAFKTGFTDSTGTSGLYTITQPTVAAPTFSPVAGTYATAQMVTITSATTGASIHYTINGSIPSETNGVLYTGPVSIGSTTTLKAMAYKAGLIDSAVTSGSYTINWPAASLNAIYNFSSSNNGGLYPSSSLVRGSDGNFYGTTSEGGSGSDGTVFMMTPSDVLTTLVAFTGANGAFPEAGLVQGSDGNFYGTTEAGGSNNNGTVFKMTPAGALTTLVSFNGANGANPYAALIQGNDGNFYGTTSSGGSANDGTVFKITPAGVLTTLDSFDGTNGFNPRAGLVQGTDGNFYGTTYGATSGSNYGTVFKLTPTNTLTALVSFNLGDGSNPEAALVQGSDGNLYGTTEYGGIGQLGTVHGTVFKMTPAGGLTTLTSFTDAIGDLPVAALVQGSDGNFYGTTLEGGSSEGGAAFKITPAGALTMLASFNGTNGFNPEGAMVQGSDGNFYGTTTNGGGVIFQLIVPPQVAAPAFNSAAGNYSSTQTVAITSATGGALIAYTTDGTTPTESGGSVTHGTLYSTPLTVSTATTLSAIAFKAGFIDSPVTSGNYTFLTQVAAPVFAPPAGTYANAQTVAMTTATSGASIIYTTDGTTPTESGGSVTHGVIYSTPVSINATTTLMAIAFEAGDADSTVTSGTYTLNASAPVFSPPAGAYTGVQAVTLTSTTTGASFRYTTDGSVPTENHGLLYAEPISITQSTTLNAIAFETGYSDSSVTNGSYSILLPPLVWLTAPVNGAVFNAPASITLTAEATSNSSTIKEVDFYQGMTLLGAATTPVSGQPGTFSFQLSTGLAAGNYVLSAVAIDNLGATATSLPENIVVNPQPGVSITSPANNNVVAAATALTLTATANASCGTVSKMQFFNGGTSLGLGTPVSGQPGTYLLTLSSGLSAGQYTLTAVATNTLNNPTTSPPVSLSVVTDQPPAITPNASSLTFGSSSNVSLSFTASDPDGSVAKVELYRDGTLDNTLTSPTSGSTWTFTEASLLPPGTYTFIGVVYDNQNVATSSAPVTVTVLESLPYFTDFEASEGYILGSLNQQLGWIVNQGSALVTNQDFYSGSQSAVLQPSVPPAQVTQGFAPFVPPVGTPNIVFVDFYAKPVAEADVTTATTFNIGSARFAFVLNGGQGNLEAFNGNGSGGGSWSSTDFTAPLAAGNQSQNWIRLTARLDFTQGTWDLYANGAMVAANLGFLDSTSTTLTSFSVQGDAATASEIDDILAGTNNPLFADVNNDGIDDAWETAQGLSLSTNDRNLPSPSGDGRTVVQDYVNGALLVLTSLVDSNGMPGAQGLVSVKVTHASDGTALANAPVTLAVTTGASNISATPGGTGSTQVSVLTDANGIASAYVSFTSSATDVLVATAQTVSLSINISPPFTSGSVAGMRLWLKSDTGVTATNGSISTWTDQSGQAAGNYASQATTANQPTLAANVFNGYPSVHFNGTSNYFTVTNFMNGAAAGELFVVLKASTTLPQLHAAPWCFGDTYGSSYPDARDGHIYDDFGSTTQQDVGKPSQDLTVPHLYNACSAANLWQARLDGALIYSGTTNQVGFRSNPEMGSLPDSPTWFFAGDVAEMIVYDHVLTDSDRAAVTQYLTEKYALAAIPAAPTNLVASAVSPTSVSLAWTPPSSGGSLVYNVERKTGTGTYVQLVQVQNALGFTDTGLTPGTSYTYRISAEGNAGSSGYSNESSATTLITGSELPTTGIKLWLKAEVGTVGEGSNISLWQDQSNGGNNANQATQPTTANQPTLVPNVFNGRPSVHFNGTSSYFTVTNFMNGATAGELFVVLKASTKLPQLHAAPWCFGDSYGSSYPDARDGHIYDDFGSTTQQDVGKLSQDLTVPHLYNACSATNLWQARLDGVLQYSGTTNQVGFTSTPEMGSLPDSPTWFFAGDVAEMIVYDHVLTDADRAAVAQYLNDKYQIVQTPPAPVNLVASVVSPTEVALAWTPVNQAISYSIERSSGGAFVQIAQVDNTTGYTDASTTSYIDTNVPAGSVLQYRVQAVNFSGVSPYSNIAYAVMVPDAIDPTDGLSFEMDVFLGLDPLADNFNALLGFPPGDGPPPPPPPNPNDAPPVVTLLTPAQATMSP